MVQLRQEYHLQTYLVQVLRMLVTTKIPFFNALLLSPHQQMGSMTGAFFMPEFNTSYAITHRNFVRIGDKIFFRKNHVPLPSIEFAPRKNI
jgi:hypothetical protein